MLYLVRRLWVPGIIRPQVAIFTIYRATLKVLGLLTISLRTERTPHNQKLGRALWVSKQPIHGLCRQEASITHSIRGFCPLWLPEGKCAIQNNGA